MVLFEKLMEKYKVQGNRTNDIEVISIMLMHNEKTLSTFNIKEFKEIEEIEILQVH